MQKWEMQLSRWRGESLSISEFLCKFGVPASISRTRARELMEWLRQVYADSQTTREELADYVFPKSPIDSNDIDLFLESDDPPHWQFSLATWKLGIPPIEVSRRSFPSEDNPE